MPIIPLINNITVTCAGINSKPCINNASPNKTILNNPLVRVIPKGDTLSPIFFNSIDPSAHEAAETNAAIIPIIRN